MHSVKKQKKMSSKRPLPASIMQVDEVDDTSSSEGEEDPASRAKSIRRAKEREARIMTKHKRIAYDGIWRRIITEYSLERLTSLFGPNPREMLWRICVAHKFRGFDPNDQEAIRHMETRVRTEIIGKESREASATQPRPIPLPPPVRPPPPPLQQQPNAPTFILPPRVLQPQPPPPPIPVNPMALADNMTPEEIEQAFVTRGLGESGKQCSVCLESKSKWTRFSWDCEHDMCLPCTDLWVKTNLNAVGSRCPGCVAEKATNPRAADPRTMFGKMCGSDHHKTVFASFQIPLLQNEIERFEASMASSSSSTPSPTTNISNIVHKCPLCMTLSVKSGTIRRCHNPRCAAEFCTKCDSAIEDGGERIKSKHIRGECSAMVAEVKKILSEKGLTPCGKCSTPLWHARCHGCHHIKCPNCGHEQCHSCGRPHKHPDCKCPVFCRPDFPCNCSSTCPECIKSKCVHCTGYCTTCLKRI